MLCGSASTAWAIVFLLLSSKNEPPSSCTDPSSLNVLKCGSTPSDIAGRYAVNFGRGGDSQSSAGDTQTLSSRFLHRIGANDPHRADRFRPAWNIVSPERMSAFTYPTRNLERLEWGRRRPLDFGLPNGSFIQRLTQRRTVGYREEFRAPAGVRKSPRKEPAGHSRWLWGFRSAADVGDGWGVAREGRDGCRQAASLRLHGVWPARHAAGRSCVGVDDHHGRASIRCRRLSACG